MGQIEDINQFYLDLNTAVDNEPSADKFYIHMLSNGGYTIDSNKGRDGIEIDRKVAKYARAQLKDKEGVDSSKLKEFYMKRSRWKKFTSSLSTEKGLIKKINKTYVKQLINIHEMKQETVKKEEDQIKNILAKHDLFKDSLVEEPGIIITDRKVSMKTQKHSMGNITDDLYKNFDTFFKTNETAINDFINWGEGDELNNKKLTSLKSVKKFILSNTKYNSDLNKAFNGLADSNIKKEQEEITDLKKLLSDIKNVRSITNQKLERLDENPNDNHTDEFS